MALLALLVLGWLLLVRPLGDALSRARERHGSAVVALAQARTQAAEIDRLQKQAPPANSEPLTLLVSQAAGTAGFPIKSVDEVGGGVRLAIEAARPQAFFAWVGEMEARGLIVVQLTARPNADRSLAAEVTFRMRQG
jgi:general secretion pathway protein M